MAEVSVSVGLLEKIAGLRKREPPPKFTPRPAISLPMRTPISSDAARLVAQDAQLNRQLQATREVAGLLVKQEASEVKRMQAMADDMLKQYSVDYKPMPCQDEAAACAQCFKENATEAWKCTAVAEAYRLCSTAAFSHSRTRVAASEAAPGAAAR